MRTATALWRACSPKPVVAITAATALLAASSGRGGRRALVSTAAVFAGQLLTGWTNDVIDADLDRRAKRSDKPIATGELSAATTKRAIAAVLPTAVVLSRAAGPYGPLIHGTGLALGAAYNLGLKATPLSFLPIAGAFALIPIYALGQVPPASTLVAGALLGIAAHLGQTLPDIGTDREAGVLGLPQRLGGRRSAVGVAALMGAAGALISIATRRKATIATAAVGTAVAVGAATAGLKNRPALAFRLTIGAASLLVAAYSLSLKSSSR